MHRDMSNAWGTPNLSVALGDFTGGELWLHDTACATMGVPRWETLPEDAQAFLGHAIDVASHGLRFDGHRWHKALPFQGDRWGADCSHTARCHRA